MKTGVDIAINHPGIFIVHHNKPGKALDSHTHDEHHLIIPLKGEITVKTRTSEMTLGPGKMIYIAPNASHAFNSSEAKGERLICNIDPSFWPDGLEAPQDIIELPQNQLIKEILFYLLLNAESPISEHLIKSLSYTLDEVIKTPKNFYLNFQSLYLKAKDERLKQCLDIMGKDFHHSLEHYAKESGMSSRTMNRLFKSELEILPKEYLLNLKIEFAKSLLKKNLTVAEVSLESGFESLSSFIKAFRKMTGTLPSDWKPL
ncbi:MAG: helix-turn-helix domain-containing protein [Bacteriovoracaceae bacterium]